jgi:hypothetical protein
MVIQICITDIYLLPKIIRRLQPDKASGYIEASIVFKNPLDFRMFMRLITLAVACLIAISMVSARDLYVGKTGCSDAGKGSFDNPWCTIRKAASVVEPGDTVYVMAGNYAEQVEFKRSGSQGKYIIFRPYGNDTVTLRKGLFAGYAVSYLKIIGFHISEPPGRRPAIRFYGNGGYVEILDNEVTRTNTTYSGAIEVGGHMHHFIIDGNHVHHCETGTAEGIKVFQHASDFNITDNLVEHNTNIGIVVNGWSHWGKPKNGLIAYNTVRYNSKKAPWSAGIYLDCTNDMIIEHNVAYGNIRGYQIGCEQPDDISEDNIMRFNIAYGNSGTGMQVGGYQGGMTRDNLIYNNIFYENGLYEIGFDSTPGEDNEFFNNIFFDPPSTLIGDPADNIFDHNLFYDRRGPGRDSIVADPLFVDIGKSDFRLKEGSPACGKGRDGADIGVYSCSGCGDGDCIKPEDCGNCRADCGECACDDTVNLKNRVLDWKTGLIGIEDMLATIIKLTACSG